MTTRDALTLYAPSGLMLGAATAISAQSPEHLAQITNCAAVDLVRVLAPALVQLLTVVGAVWGPTVAVHRRMNRIERAVVREHPPESP